MRDTIGAAAGRQRNLCVIDELRFFIPCKGGIGGGKELCSSLLFSSMPQLDADILQQMRAVPLNYACLIRVLCDDLAQVLYVV